jgi:hypothetical protein
LETTFECVAIGVECATILGSGVATTSAATSASTSASADASTASSRLWPVDAMILIEHTPRDVVE